MLEEKESQLKEKCCLVEECNSKIDIKNLECEKLKDTISELEQLMEQQSEKFNTKDTQSKMDLEQNKSMNESLNKEMLELAQKLADAEVLASSQKNQIGQQETEIETMKTRVQVRTEEIETLQKQLSDMQQRNLSQTEEIQQMYDMIKKKDESTSNLEQDANSAREKLMHQLSEKTKIIESQQKQVLLL